ncbi:putative ABC transporter ATP-binding protein [Roseovarius sp. A-2]|uniref:ABC transporter ATP-binding protein n=1 Tax=Roseovarius sp. A-2 TaxID=1570360 RepID=UPI0009B57C17|nr:ABC transporter ATP-binding protein [Roseovarius sp. A-2]GAW34045.1 putative ABC transporter ATP-binding protein [Roseovarius sp. A-2]
MSKPDQTAEAPTLSSRDRANLRWFWRRYLRRRAPWLILVLGMILVQGVVYQQFLAITETGLRVIFEHGTLRELAVICLAVFGLFVLRGAMGWLVPRIAATVSNGAIHQMRGDLIGHVLRLDLAYFDRTRSGEILQRIVMQTQTLGHFIGLASVNALRDAATVVIVSAYLIWMNPLLFGAAVLVLPVIVWVMNHVSARVRTLQGETDRALGGYMSAIEETVGAMRTVKIAGQEEVEAARLEKDTAKLRDLSLNLQRAQALVMPSIDLSSAVVYVLVIGGGGYMVLSPSFDMDGAAIITFLLGLVLVFDPARLLAQYLGQFQAHMVVLDRLRALMDTRPAITDAPDAVSAFDTGGDIVFDNVRFDYNADQPLFDELSVRFEGGKVSAIVGPTGAGKTTVLSLLSRLYDVQGGEITIGGTPIRNLRIPALRAAFAVVAQDIVIFDNSIRENIRYVRPDASEAEIRQAAENAEIAELIRERGDTPVGPRGAQLSAGQRQRIAIARAFLTDAPILLLDEATSALDQGTEARIRSALQRLTKGRTTIVVAHRLASVADADCIHVLKAGRLVEQGRHGDLVACDGVYARLLRAQGADGR